MSFFSLFIALLVTAVWGFNFVVVKFCLGSISPVMLCLLRSTLSSIPFLFFIKPPKSRSEYVVLFGFVTFVLQFSLMFFSIYLGLDPGLSALLLQTQMFFSLFISVVFLKEHMRGWHIAGCAISFAGIGIVIGHLDAAASIAGLLAVLGGALCSSISNYIAKKAAPVNTVSLVVWGNLAAIPFLLLGVATIDGPFSFISTYHSIDQGAIYGVLYITFISTIFAYSAWSWLLGHHPMRLITPFSLLVPIFALLTSWLLLGEAMEPWKIFATVLVLSGLAINLFGHHIFRIPTPYD